MTVFWLRIGFFSLMWIYMIYTSSTLLPISIIFFAASLGIYFLLTVPHQLIWKYSSILLLLTTHGYFFTEEPALTVILLLFVVMDASFRVKNHELMIIFLVTSICIFVQTAGQDFTLELLVFLAFLGFLSLKINQMMVERREQQEIYEELLNEFRTMKRMHITAENNARLKERTRIARDIHDSVGHRLTALIMKLEMLSIQENHPAYEELKEMAKDSLEDTRTAVKALQVEESEGIATVMHLIRKLEAESHLLVQFTLKQGVLSVPITNKMSVVLYRVIQEALTNIMRHGDTRDAHIILSKSAADDILFEISNPIRSRKPFTYGFGLTNMKERVEEINGELQIYQTENQFIVSGKLVREE